MPNRKKKFWIGIPVLIVVLGVAGFLYYPKLMANGSSQKYRTARVERGEISSAYKTCKQLLDSHYSADEWNIYLFHFSDGDNSSEADSRDCVKLLKEQLLPICNMFGYCQVTSAYGSGSFLNVLREAFPRGLADQDGPKLITTKVDGRDDILESLRAFFKAGR